MKLLSMANDRRIEGIAQAVSSVLPHSAFRMLDVGCGDGSLARRIMELRPAVSLEGVEVVLPRERYVPMQAYDGAILPFADNAFDAVLCADMLHHTASPVDMLREACRVARSYVVVKDHVCDSRIDRVLLTFMDWLGNVGKGVPMPFHFLSSRDWRKTFDALPCVESARLDGLRYWGWPLTWVIDRSFHFVAVLETSESESCDIRPVKHDA